MFVKNIILRKVFIMNYKFNIDYEKRICDIILIIILVATYFILSAIGVSPAKHIFNVKNKEIDWDIFQVKPSQIKFNNKLAAPTTKNDDMSIENSNVLIPDIALLESEIFTQINIAIKNHGAIDIPATKEVDTKISITPSEKLPKIASLSFDNSNFSFTADNAPSNYEIEGPSINIEYPTNINTNFPTNKLRNMKKLHEISDDKAIPEPEVIKIELRPEAIEDNDKNISPIIHELIVWMKENPVSFSSVFKKFMHYEQSDLTSHIKFEANNKLYELFILCKVNILEIRICLIENKNLILLIDSGLKEKSNYLRLGSILRANDGSISSFISRQETPSSDITDNFYKIFLSWWDQIKNKSQQQEYKR